VKVLGLGVALTGVVTGAEYLAWGSAALVPGVAFGLLATAIQVIAVRQLRKGLSAPYRELMGRFGIGMALRFGGIILFVIAVLANEILFPPLPAGLAYLGVVVPLLFAETRLAQ
jgi:hypothetical protein